MSKTWTGDCKSSILTGSSQHQPSSKCPLMLSGDCLCFRKLSYQSFYSPPLFLLLQGDHQLERQEISMALWFSTWPLLAHRDSHSTCHSSHQWKCSAGQSWGNFARTLDPNVLECGSPPESALWVDTHPVIASP